MARHVVCRAEQLPPGSRRIVLVGGSRGIGVFNVHGSFYALKNVCPHQCGPLCLGEITGTSRARPIPGRRPEIDWIREGEILRCPWHAWEFDITTGRTLFRPMLRVGTYPVFVDPKADDALPVQSEDLTALGQHGGGLLAVDGSEEGTDHVETYPVTVEGDWVILEA